MAALVVQIERVKPIRPISASTMAKIELLDRGFTLVQVAKRLGVKATTVQWHIQEAARRLPGDLPARFRVIAWYRGAPRHVLEGFARPPENRLAAALAGVGGVSRPRN